ncbi:hypothetical protein CO112_00995 [Candidatus Dojkabacteria bacterium CG_4_9_14_3_um_filter_150_Dojkabacteria_WS6_41_13]|nr:MAG: hypothetical protein CO112_00995 [Candidatus Dojkabacteria bacterium CG_4_9_14_3_um_filter_150_Dojkabacteria_WS6_41_13]
MRPFDTLLYRSSEPLKIPSESYEKCFSTICLKLSGKESRGNAKMAPQIFEQAVSTLEVDGGVREKVVQLLVVGSIMIQVIDNLEENPERSGFAIGAVHRSVCRELLNKGFDQKIIKRLSETSIRRLVQMREAMQKETDTFIFGSSEDYDTVAAQSNGLQYLASLLDESIDDKPCSPIHQINLATRLLVDSATTHKDLTNAKGVAPNIILKSILAGDARTISGAITLRQHQFKLLFAKIEQLVQRSPEKLTERLFLQILIATKDYMRKPIPRAVILAGTAKAKIHLSLHPELLDNLRTA